MRRLLVFLCLCLAAVGVVLAILLKKDETETVIPTLMALPSLTPSETRSPTFVVTQIPTSFRTPTTASEETTIPTNTATLSVRVLEITAVMDPIQVLTPIPAQLTAIPAPPLPHEPLPDGANSASPFTGWYSFESDYPSVNYEPAWAAQLSQAASRGQYHRSDRPGSSVQFPFEGEGLRVRYVAAQNMGIFELRVDGRLLERIDAFADALGFPGTEVYFVGSGNHVLEIIVTGEKSADSTGYVVGLDAIQVYRTRPDTLIVPPPQLTVVPTTTPQPAARIELVNAPPTLQPTPSPVSPRLLNPSVLIAYDENGNRTVDPAEGVAGISVRLVEINTNQVMTSTVTDARGYAAFELISDVPARVVVPYFGRTWDIQRGSGATSAFTLLLTPGNQPGLIP